MGNSLICPCSEPPKEGVILMRSDGTLLRLKKGVHAKEVLSMHPGHRVVRCDSNRTVLWGSAELESTRLYFLVPEEKARCRATYEMFWKVGVARGLVPAKKWNYTEVSELVGGQLILLEGAAVLRKMPWTPRLGTISEISPEESRREVAEEMRSLGEQIASSPVRVH